jgi:hypothetical protein
VLAHPAYSPDLTPCNFHIFGPLRKALKSCVFTSDDGMQEIMIAVRQLPKEFFADRIHRVMLQWDSSVYMCDFL